MLRATRLPPAGLLSPRPAPPARRQADIAAVALKHKLDGLIVSNTTIQRPGSAAQYPEAREAGGLSGPPLLELSTSALADMYRLTKGQVTLVGCGGVSSGEDAYKKIRAGECASWRAAWRALFVYASNQRRERKKGSMQGAN